MAEGTSNTADELLATAQRRRRVLALREEGHTLRAIAAMLEDEFGAVALPNGWDSRYVAKDIKRVLQQVRTDLEEDARDVLRVELRRLDRLQQAFFSAALQGDTAAFDRVLKAMERRAKYLGLDEPDELRAMVQTDPELVQTLMQALQDFPEAREAAADALAGGAADD